MSRLVLLLWGVARCSNPAVEPTLIASAAAAAAMCCTPLCSVAAARAGRHRADGVWRAAAGAAADQGRAHQVPRQHTRAATAGDSSAST
jgi:hypothetical protein